MKITIEYSDAALNELRSAVGIKKVLGDLVAEGDPVDLLALAICAAAESRKDCTITIPVTAEYAKRVAAARKRLDANP